jgi:hypothetical protein
VTAFHSIDDEAFHRVEAVSILELGKSLADAQSPISPLHNVRTIESDIVESVVSYRLHRFLFVLVAT